MTKSRLFTVLLVSVLGACSKQGEGDTCMRSNLNEDCESGLVCVSAKELEEFAQLGEDYAADRCCPEGNSQKNAHCKPRKAGDDVTTTEPTNTTNGGGGADGTTNSTSSQGGSTSGT